MASLFWKLKKKKLYRTFCRHVSIQLSILISTLTTNLEVFGCDCVFLTDDIIDNRICVRNSRKRTRMRLKIYKLWFQMQNYVNLRLHLWFLFVNKTKQKIIFNEHILKKLKKTLKKHCALEEKYVNILTKKNIDVWRMFKHLEP